MAFPDLSWPCRGILSTNPISEEESEIIWNIEDYLSTCSSDGDNLGESKIKLKTENVSVHGATLNLFAYFYGQKIDSLLGINIEGSIFSSSNTEYCCLCNISFKDKQGQVLEKIKSKFKCKTNEYSHWAVKDFLTSSKLEEFLLEGKEIICRINLKETEIAHSSKRSSAEAFDHEIHKSRNDKKPKISPANKVYHDLKQLLMSGEYSDVTILVQDQQFTAHRSILAARSPVFASMFRHNTKEKVTGILNVEDCEPSDFQVLLDYLYYGSTEKLSVENMLGLYTIADKYDVQDLKLDCLEFIKNNLSVDTFCETVCLSLQHSATDLLKVIPDFFARNMKEIVITVKWQDFILKNPIQGNDILIKALESDANLLI